MIRRFLSKVFAAPLFRPARPRVIGKGAHRIPRDRISPCAARTCETLQRHGFHGYVVGGAVRDLMLGLTPKDFDIATDARPEQIRALFRRSRIIGRRFRLVHVMCGAEMVEVATYRGAADSAAGEGETNGAHATDEHGRVLRDNVFGTQQQDAYRRDFTVNALFYDPVREEVIDYVDGVKHLKARRLAMIGEPDQRYREDPVRMLRAVRLAASRGLEIDARTRKPIRQHSDLLQNVPAPRLLDEMLKLLLSGHSAPAVTRLRKEGLHHGLLPLLDVILEQPLGERFVMLALRRTDERVLAGKPVSPGFLFAALLWHEVLAAWRAREERGEKSVPALVEAAEQVLAAQCERLAIPRRYSTDMKDVWLMQPRLLQRGGQRPFRLLEHERFRAGYDFLLMRCESGELPREVGQWWTRFQDAGDDERRGMLLKEEAGPRRRRRRRRGGGAATPAAAA
jgi:poly(A) polymerase